MLKTLGYNIDRIDGIAGQQTKDAINVFYTDIGKLSSGTINDDLILDLSTVIKDRFDPKS